MTYFSIPLSTTSTVFPALPTLLFSSVLLLSSNHAVAACTGDACGDIDFGFENGCYKTTNNGQRKVKVELGIYGFELRPNQTHILRLNSNCPQVYMGGEKAYYIDSPRVSDSKGQVSTSTVNDLPRPEPLPRNRTTPSSGIATPGVSNQSRISGRGN